ncbi:uncharacterized protein LOC107361543 [Tetranychus urticae]|nr:uncharacterized protein LOC107361543 [Tetranychus urticae]XP_015783869.1 uncharacterized protein LOC107361543 [Tetranychus urticae]
MAIRLITGRKKRLIAILIFIGLLYLLVTLLTSSSANKAILTCNYGPETQDALHDLLIRTKESLDSLGLTYFLCYNSLWGALKMGTVLPWVNYLEICTINDELSRMDEAFIFRIFKSQHLRMSYISSEGVYLVHDETVNEPEIKLVLFEKDSVTSQYRRVGWRNRLVPPNSCAAIHCFPPMLIEKPLPVSTLLNIEISVPREKEEIQKYLFPDDWWKDIEPEKCKTENH